MEPVLLICGGCGVKIRAADPDRARARDCPRCGTPLAPAVAAALAGASHRGEGRPRGPDAATGDNSIVPTDAGTHRRAGLLGAGLALVGVALVAPWLAADLLPVGVETAAIAPPAAVVAAAPHPAAAVAPRPTPVPAPEPIPADSAAQDVVEATEPVAPEPGPPPTVADPARLALREGDGPAQSPAPPPARPADPVPPPPAADAPPAPLIPSEPRRLLIRDTNGKAVVAREHGMMRDQMAVVMPDGTIGWPTTQIFTDDQFTPYTRDEMERRLLDGEYATFRVIKTKHYLVFYQSTERFARDSADLLEDLYDKLTGALERQKLPVVAAEFPLIAVIFRSEDDFRAHNKVPGEVQAFYEILSNRIFFYEKGRRDASAPEVSLLRKPQTVAHEGTHQLLNNVGIQRRLSPWPIWLVEGLAEYCSPPKPTKQGGANWAGLGQINPMHLTTIRDLDDPMSSVVRGGPQAPTGRDRGQPLVEYLVTRTDLTPTDYALSWGLTHYLARDKDRLDQFTSYIRKLNQLRPFEVRTPDQQLNDFRAAFGRDLAKLDAQVGKYLAKLKIPDSQVLPFYAVLLQQPVSNTAFRRMAMVSQSPSVIRQWVETANNSSGGTAQWQVVPHPTRTRAVLTADGWISQGH